MEKFVSKTMENLKLKENNLLFEQLTKNSLIAVLSKMANSVNMTVDKSKLKKTLGKVKYVNYLNYNQFDVEVGEIRLSKDLKAQDFKTKVYILASAFARALTADNDKSLLNKGMEEVLADLVVNELSPKITYNNSKNRFVRDYMKIILAASGAPYQLMAEYFLTDGLTFNRKIAYVAGKNNISLEDIDRLKSTQEDVSPVCSYEKFDYAFNAYSLYPLMEQCFKNEYQGAEFLFNNLFLEDYLRRRFLTDGSIESFELFALQAGSSLKLTDDLHEISNYFNFYPYNFYRIRPFVDEKSLGSNISNVLKENDSKFNAIVADIKAGKFKDNLNNYTHCYNCHASADDRLVFLKQLVLSNGITNGFLLNELLEIIVTTKEPKKIRNLKECGQDYRLIDEATAQFLKYKARNLTARYDAYTSKALSTSLRLMDKYYGIINKYYGTKDWEKAGSISILTRESVREYIKLQGYETAYLRCIYHKNDLLRNPESLSDEELTTIVNDENLPITKKYFQEVLNSRRNSTPKYR